MIAPGERLAAPRRAHASAGALLSNLVRAAAGLVVGGLFLFVVMRQVDLGAVGASLARASALPLALATLAFLADFVLRAVRFWMMLQVATGRVLPLRPMIGPFIASFGISDVLPLRVGDAFRVVWFHRRFAIANGALVGAMLVERILDLTTIALIGCVSLLVFGAAERGPALYFAALFALAALGGIALLLLPAALLRAFGWLARTSRRPAISKAGDFLRTMAESVAVVGSWRRATAFVLMSAGLWLLESTVMLGAWLGLGGSAGELAKPFVAFAFSTIGTLVPSLPGHFGSFEMFGLMAFGLAGVGASFAASVLLVAHLILWLPTAIFGIVWSLSAFARNRLAHSTA